MGNKQTKQEYLAEKCGEMRDALASLQELKEGFEEWRESMPENLEDSPTMELLNEVCDSSAFDDIENGLDEIENLTLPKGFGRD